MVQRPGKPCRGGSVADRPGPRRMLGILLVVLCILAGRGCDKVALLSTHVSGSQTRAAAFRLEQRLPAVSNAAARRPRQLERRGSWLSPEVAQPRRKGGWSRRSVSVACAAIKPVLGWQGLLAMLVTICLDVCSSTLIKLAVQNSAFLPVAFLIQGLTYFAFSVSLRYWTLSAAYATWGGVSCALIAVVGRVYFGEALSLSARCSIGLIVLGVLGLNLT
ncbi:unnamed protein product [Polarella glacialis]|uniref:EamA domain-containing protein n=1 Tax=Polarella glacialis TaxID=89957 RepID=A0A813K5T0_POLGL|nr:unnamed protein product [Polarella glacialis]|mmetsp:Transcript_88717/g.159959  ORF Transcript_88717/g.159959 Transcript_88717/m.159959 type:complete len:219 (-) Transcript_88717:84-740(-)